VIEGRDYFGVFPEWLRPDDWCEVPFTHTITQTTCYGIPHFNPGTSLYLVEDRAPLPGEMFIWCQKSFDDFPTAPVWGRFMDSTPKGDKVLTRMGDVVVLPLGPGPLPTKADYAYRFRIVGSHHERCGPFALENGARTYARSEIPFPIPSKAVTTDQPFEFDLLQDSVKRLNRLMDNLTDVVDMADDLVDLAPKTDDATGDLLGRLGRQARAYRAIQPIINAAMAQGVEVESRMTAFLKESPELARNLARWQADD
jgi:hypothetical protein